MLRRRVNYAHVYDQKVVALKNRIYHLHESKNDIGIKSQIKNQPLNLLVEALESIDDIDLIIRFIISAYKIKMGQLFLSLSETNKLRILSKLKNAVMQQLLEDLNADDVYELLSIVSPQVHKKIIFNASKELKEEIKKLKSFNFAHVGSIMNTTFATLLAGMQVGEAVNYLRINKDEFDIGEEIFVVNSDEEIVGSVRVKDLLFLDKSKTITEIVDKAFFSVGEVDDIDEVIDLFKKYSVSTVAVLDAQNKLVGIVSYNDVIPEILDSNIEDVYRFYGIRETKRSYLNSDISEIVKSRIFCLIMMLLAATFTTLAIDKFELMGVDYTAGISTAVLVPIIPVITDMCGNTGSQTTATVIQAVAAGDVKESDFFKVVKKELKVAVIIGAILAICNFYRLLIYYAIFQIDSKKFHTSSLQKVVQVVSSIINSSENFKDPSKLFKLGIVGALSSSLALFLVVIFSKFFGVLVPFLAIRFNYDPASVSAPALTTILDTIASVIFFGIGILLIQAAIKPIFNVNVNDGKLASATIATLKQMAETMGFEPMHKKRFV
ncbi:magnesium transporter [Candidatus Mycoplasma haematobovis]|uniref:magnesium transporter n=1 Tax=Candidatus Mycoplasma haematobovis TaxID=432608 RepID=UPI00165054A0